MEWAAHVRVIEWITRGCNLYSRNFVLILVGVICALTASIITVGALLGPMIGGIFIVLLKIIRRNEQNIKNLLVTQSEMPIPGDVFQGLEFFKPTMFHVWWEPVDRLVVGDHFLALTIDIHEPTRVCTVH